MCGGGEAGGVIMLCYLHSVEGRGRDEEGAQMLNVCRALGRTVPPNVPFELL